MKLQRSLHQVLVLVLFCLPLVLQAQNKPRYTVSGYVEDAETGEKLIGASVFDLGTGLGVSTNTYGFYSLTLPGGDSVQLGVSYIGMEDKFFSLLLDSNRVLNVFMGGMGQAMEQIEVTAAAKDRLEDRVQMSQIEISAEQIKALPALLGEVDVLRVLQLLPGVQSGEASSGIYVRGGSPDQNLILLDGVPVYNAYHLFGFFSVFNADAIKNVQLTKGGYPARFGGRLSSVLEINLKEGNSKRFRGEGSIGLISSRLTLEGPIIKDRTSFIVSARRTYIDILAAPFIALAQTAQGGGGFAMPKYYFYDLNAKINHKFNEQHRLFLSLYSGDDIFGFNYRETDQDPQTGDEQTFKLRQGLSWGNTTSALRWNWLINNKLFCNTTLTYSQYRFRIDLMQEERLKPISGAERVSRFDALYKSAIRDWALKLDFDYIPDPNHHLRFGLNATHHLFSPGAAVIKSEGSDPSEALDLRFGNESVGAGDFSAYIEDDMRLGKRLRANIGLHASGFLVQKRFYPSVQPRVSMRYLLPKDLAIKASFATMTQFIHLLTNEGIGLPTDLWLPSTAQVLPEQSWQAAVGVAKTIFEDYELSVEGYYRHMRNLISYKPGASFLEPGSRWEDKIEGGGLGQSYGAEVFLQRKVGNFTGWIAYTLAWNWRQFEGTDINAGRRYPFKYDRRHDIALVGSYKFSERFQASATWVYGTGNATTLPVERFVMPGDFGSTEIEGFGAKNSYRMRAYHRLDLSLDIIKKYEKWESSWSFGVYNAYNRQNPFFIFAGMDDRSGQRVFKQASLFPIIPSIRWNFKF